MDHQINGLLRVRVIRGVNLAVRDLRSSDPYAVVKMGKQKVRTRVVKRNVNPEWNEELTLTISDVIHPIRIEVYDKDTFTRDDSMGFAEIDLHPFMEAVETRVDDNPGTIVVQKILPNKQNFLVQESCIKIVGKKVIQDLYLRLQDVECGEVELQLEWISIKKPKKL